MVDGECQLCLVVDACTVLYDIWLLASVPGVCVMHPFFLIAGVVLGLVFSVTTVAGAVWCVQISMRRGFMSGLAAGGAIAAAQSFWAFLAALIIFKCGGFGYRYDWLFRICAILILGSMALTVFQSQRIQSINYTGPIKGVFKVFKTTLGIALTMPMRLPGYLALLVSVSLHYRPRGVGDALLLGAGVGVGSLVWWLWFVVLAVLFGQRVPEPVTLKSMNKLKTLAGSVLLALMIIGAAPLVPGFIKN